MKKLRKIIKRGTGRIIKKGTALIPLNANAVERHRDLLHLKYQSFTKRTLYFLKTKKLFSWLVIYPWLIVALYIGFIQSPVYQSSARILLEKDIQQTTPMGPGIMGSGPAPQEENHLTSKYILSRELLGAIENNIGFKDHYQSKKVDFLSRLEQNPSQYTLLKYYRNQVSAVVDPSTKEIIITAAAYSPEKARELLAEIISKTKQFVNRVSNTLAHKQFEFTDVKLQLAKKKLFQARKKLIEWQNQNGMYNPQETAQVVSSVMAKLKGNLVEKQTEYITYSSFMQPGSNKLLSLKEEINALKEQIGRQTSLLLGKKEKDGKLNQVMFDFEWVQLELKFAQAEYQAAQQAYDTAAINLAKNQNMVIEIEKPDLPDAAASPQRLYELINVLVLLLFLFLLARMSIILVREHID